MDSCKCRKEPERKRTLDEFPMEHSREDTQRFFRERRELISNQHKKLLTSNGESSKLKSYSRRRFESALSIKDDESLPPPSPDDTTLFYEESRPSWSKPPSYNRHVSMCNQPVTHSVQLSARPYSGPCLGISNKPCPQSNGKRREFNHLRKTSSAYPTLRRRMIESNAMYRLVCPQAGSECCERCNRPTVDCIRKDDFLLVRREEEDNNTIIESKEEKGKRQSDKEAHVHFFHRFLSQQEEEEVNNEEEDIQEYPDEREFVMTSTTSFQPGKASFGSVNRSFRWRMSTNEQERLGSSETDPKTSPKQDQQDTKKDSMKSPKSTIGAKSTKMTLAAAKQSTFPTKSMATALFTKGGKAIKEEIVKEPEPEPEEEEEEDERPESPWRCWVDDATVSSVVSIKGEAEIAELDDLIIGKEHHQSHTHVVLDTAHTPNHAAHEDLDNPTNSKGHQSPGVAKSESRKSGRKSHHTPTPERRSKLGVQKGKKKGDNQGATENKEEIFELVPQPSTEEISEPVVEELPPEPVPPTYICPSSVLKSNQTEIKMWLQKSTFSAANRLLPIY